MPEENTGPRQFKESDKATGREYPTSDPLRLGDIARKEKQALKDSLKIRKIYRGPLGESYKSPIDVEQARKDLLLHDNTGALRVSRGLPPKK